MPSFSPDRAWGLRTSQALGANSGKGWNDLILSSTCHQIYARVATNAYYDCSLRYDANLVQYESVPEDLGLPHKPNKRTARGTCRNMGHQAFRIRLQIYYWTVDD